MNNRKVNSDEMSSEDKENQSFEAHESTVKTPLKQTATSNQLLAEIQPAAFGHLTTPPKPNDISPGDPWTPTANLKMLISAASPEIRNREQEKRLSDSRSENLEDRLSGDEYEKSQPSRKEKSLGLLCHKFLACYPSYPNTSKNNDICLDEVAEELNVERRRIYDIMNVLESLHMVSRLAKNRYSWHGRHNLKKTLQVLKKVAEESKYTEQLELIKKREFEQEPEEDGKKIRLMAKDAGPDIQTDICFVELPGMEFRAASVNSRKDKSLRVMSQKFVMLFLVSSPQVVSLEVAAKILIGEDHVEYLDKSKFKTKIRRLYDIANVLSSLELIKKVHVTEEKGRKPAFKWTGPAVFSDIQGTQSALTPAMISTSHPLEGKRSKENCSKNLFPTRSKQGFTRHPSLIKLAKSIQNDQRKIRSAPSSPIKKNTSHIPSSFPNKMAQLAAICKQQLDEQSRGFRKINMRLDHPPMPCTLASPPESCLKTKPFLLPSQTEIPPLIPNSVSPAILPPIHSNVPYAVYLHPSQTQVVTAYNPGFPVQPVPCANTVRMKFLVEASSRVVPGQRLTEDNGSSLEDGDKGADAKDWKIWLPKEQEKTKDVLMPDKCFKRCKTLLEDSPTKKCKSDEADLQDVLLTWLPSGYLIPLPQCTKLVSETTFLSKGKAEGSVGEHKSSSSPTAGGIPVTSDLTAVNFPAFHIAPLNLMLPPSSVAAIPVVNSTTIASAQTSPIQAPSSSVLNFTLQNLGLIPASIQMPANQVLGSALIFHGAEQASSVPKSVGLKQGEALQNVLPKYSCDLNGKPVLAIPLQQTTVPMAPRDSEKGNENIFQMSSESAMVPGFCSSSCESDGISQGTLGIALGEFDVSPKDKI